MTTAQRRGSLSPLARAAALALGGVAGLAGTAATFAQAVPATALPSGAQVQAGQASITTQGAQMTVRNTPGAILNWQRFDIGAGAGVHFEQANAASRVLNRVAGNDPSRIFGTLSSNGQVWLLNPHGVLFGAGARVDVAGLVASTLRLNDNDFLAGRHRFAAADGDAPAAVRNEGTIASTEGGQVVLLGARVENTGDIHTPRGQAALVAGERVELVDTALPNVVVRLREGAGEVYHGGRISAPGGRVDLLGAIVNHEGLVRADTLAPDAQGRIVLRAADTLTLGAGSVTAATADAAAAPAGRGGTIDLLGAQVALTGNARVDASGAAGGGTVRVGGGEQGRDASVPNARAVFIGRDAELRADATGAHGDGGRIVVWSDEATRAYGRFSARGGLQGGNGGFVETSGGWLDARPLSIDVSARGGRPGQWLLDPFDIAIVSGDVADDNISAGPVFTSTADPSVLTAETIAAALDAGTSVRVVTGGGATGRGFGDITMNATLAVAPPQGVTLSLEASRDIAIGGSQITSTGAPLSLALVAGGETPGAITIANSTIQTAGGDLTLRGATPTTLTLPDGSTVTRNVAVGRAGSLQGPPPRPGVDVQESDIDLGGGTFAAAGYSPGTALGLRIVGGEGPSVINAGRIDLFGAGPAGGGVGIADALLTATQSLRIEGAGLSGVTIAGAAQLALNAAAGADADFSLVGRGGNGAGVQIATGLPAPAAAVTVANGSFTIDGHSLADAGVRLANPQAPVQPRLDLAGATGAAVSAPERGGVAASIEVSNVTLALPAAGATTFAGAGGVLLDGATVTGGSGTLSLAGARVEVVDSAIVGTGLAVDVATVAPANNVPGGVRLVNSTVNTGGGNVRFGAVQTVTSPLLGTTPAAGPWVEQADSEAFGAALDLQSSTVDAGTGVISGGGAHRGPGAGVGVFDSTLRAGQIHLAGRSEADLGLWLQGSTLAATAQLTLTGQSAGAASFASGLHVFGGTSLQVSGAGAGSQLALRGENLAGGPGLVAEGGSAANEGAPTRIVANGAALSLTGIASGSMGLQLLGEATESPGEFDFAPRTASAAQPARPAGPPRLLAVAPGTSGLTIDGRGATSVSLTGQAGSGGAGIEIVSVELQGPVFADRATTLASTGALRLDNSLVTSAGPVSLAAEGTSVNGSLLSLLDTTLTTGGALALDGQATSGGIGGGIGVSLLSGNVLAGRSVAIAGRGSGGAPGVAFLAAGAGSSVEATGGNLTVDGGPAVGAAPTITFAGGWSLRAVSTLSLLARNALPLAGDEGSGLPSFRAGERFDLTVEAPGGLTLGPGQAIDTAALSSSLAAMPAAATTTLRAGLAGGTLTIDGALAVPSRLAIEADRLTIGSGGSLAAGGSGDAIVLRGATAQTLAAFANDSSAGSAVLATPAGRWVLLLADPRQARLGGLVADATVFGLAANPNAPVPLTGNVFGFGIAPAAGFTADPATASTNHVLEAGRHAVWVPMEMSTPTKSRTFDAAVALEGNDEQPGGTLDWSGVTREEAMTLLAARGRYKQKVFAKGVFKVREDPRLADAPVCTNEAELETGKCLITEELKQRIQQQRAAAAQAAMPPAPSAAGPLPRPGQRRVLQAELPGIQRKLALLIGVNQYDDARVPELTGAVPDVRAVRSLLEGRLGYEATVLENPKREDVLRAFNRLALQALTGDSVIVYYAGHGVVVPVNGVETGFWLPADVDAELPDTWISNADIARLVGAVGARQLMLVSDSCYSGTLVGKERVQLGGSTLDADELLKRRAAVVMSSGGDEPVADSGRGGHSIFAWHFMRAIESLDRWQVGGNLFERVRDAVVKDFPQTPQYGASRTAGHQGNTDYLFERRALEGRP